MRFMLLWLAVSYAVTSCTTVNVFNDRLKQLTYVDSAFQDTYENFFLEANNSGIRIGPSKITIIFGNPKSKENPNAIGICSHEDNLIVIEKQTWDKYDARDKEQLLFHELGHCLLNRDHCSLKDSDNIVSIMYPNMLPSDLYKSKRKAYIDELFKPDKRCSDPSSNSDGVDVRTRESEYI